ncbi:hypothetical protein GQ43DRAFT_415606 [Delitschia confertaspora ATCC 74209]|uniref:HNH domain-containing protein n=1 Tax=Delitschia confertaspora ATCC 74209 TaxID=1513339 RepID=A0A9P4JS16_9PLEO|nr:hypothetical protein GQ43DRAFT_415606 [Delitschia confertaspora ATCC 74209]
MTEEIPPEEQANYETFRECLSEVVIKGLALPEEEDKRRKKGRKERKGRKNRKSKDGVKNGNKDMDGSQVVEKKGNEEPQSERKETEGSVNEAEDLAEFTDYISALLFPSLPPALRTLTHSAFKASESLRTLYSPPLTHSTAEPLISLLPPLAIDTLSSSSLLPSTPDQTDIYNFFTPLLSSYITAVTAPPPIWSTTRKEVEGCELCGRDWIPLTYHHLIPRSTHERVLKRGWHNEDMLNSVAWLCRMCHSFVHRVASNEELAKCFYTVELLEEREDVRVWVKWVGGVRWKKR